MSHWFEWFESSRQSCRCPMDARRSSDVEVPTESLDLYSWRKMLASSRMKDVRCRSWTFINVRIRGLSGSSGLSVFSGLVAGFRMPFVWLVRYLFDWFVWFVWFVWITTANKEFTQFVSSYHGAGRPQNLSKTSTPAFL